MSTNEAIMSTTCHPACAPTVAHRAARYSSAYVVSPELARAWGYSELYLHAATKDAPLLAMYDALDYEQLPDFDQPDWVLATSGREATRYHRRALPAPEASAV